jgi:hypothetical protein
MPTTCPALLISFAKAYVPPGRLDGVVPFQMVAEAVVPPTDSLIPTTCPASLIEYAKLSVLPGKGGSSVTLYVIESAFAAAALSVTASTLVQIKMNRFTGYLS